MKKHFTLIDALKYVFYLVVLFLPINLGKHFIFNYAYVNGLLVDYLIPVIYLQDLLVVIFIFLSIIAFKKNLLSVSPALNNYLRLLIFFILSYVFSTLISANKVVSISYATRSLLYALFSICTISFLTMYVPFKNILKILFVSVIFICTLGLLQTIKQSSIFNNYLFFGEQPYTVSTYGIAKEHIHDFVFVPPYATFRHPNVFAGFLTIIIIWFLHQYITSREKRYLFITLFGVCLITLTLSINSIATLAFGFISLFSITVYNLKLKKLLLSLSFTIFFVMITVFSVLPYLSDNYFNANPSFYRRTYLGNITTSSIQKSPYFGYGANTNVYYISKVSNFFDMKYMQPVHNIFLLLLFENGIYGLATFLFLLGFCIYLSIKRDTIFYVSIFQLMLLGLFDHFIFTHHQTNLLMWLTLCFCIAYNGTYKYVK